MTTMESTPSSASSSRNKKREEEKLGLEAAAFRHRLLHRRLEWRDYVSLLLTWSRNKDNNQRQPSPASSSPVLLLFGTNPKTIVRLRERVIRVVKTSATTFCSEMCSERSLSRPPPPRVLRHLPLQEQNHLYVCFGTSLLPSSSPQSRGNSVCRRRDALKTFVLDTGSKHVTSDADITILNAPCIGVLDHIVQSVNAVFSKDLGIEFGLREIGELFDVHIFVNSFLVSLRGRMCFPSFHSLSKRTQASQRRRSKSRLAPPREEKGEKKDECRKLAEMNVLMKKKTEAVLTGNVSRFVDLTSCLEEQSGSDAYISQGAFLHVLMEIQAGVPLRLSPHEYLDSAYDNLGMLAATVSIAAPAVSTAAPVFFDASDFSKYVSRAVHALKRFVESVCYITESRKSKTLSCSLSSSPALLEQVVRFLDENSVPDLHNRPRVYCSMANLSKSVSVKNKPSVTFRSILTGQQQHQKKPCDFFVPYRKPTLDARAMLRNLLRLFSLIEHEEKRAVAVAR